MDKAKTTQKPLTAIATSLQPGVAEHRIAELVPIFIGKAPVSKDQGFFIFFNPFLNRGFFNRYNVSGSALLSSRYMSFQI
jgi:hypothetical protein